MRSFNFVKKLKEQKGATGVDIVVSITVISITIAIVIAIYTNVDLTSKRIKRTAGATRIATSMVEQIDKMYYSGLTDQISEMDSMIASMSPTSTPYITYNVAKRQYTIMPKYTSDTIRIFNTKVPKGYTVKISFEKDYEYDIVKKVNIEVEFLVGNQTESVQLSSAKALEIVELGNEPEIDSNKITDVNGNEYYNVVPIKREGSEYKKTDENDDEWYNYEAGIWATVLGDLTYINSYNGKLKDGYKDYVYVWIPSYGKAEDGKLRLKYKDTNYGVISKIIEGTYRKSVFTIDINGKQLTDFSESVNFKDITGKKLNGVWVKASDIETNEYSKLLNESEYGPFEL